MNKRQKILAVDDEAANLVALERVLAKVDVDVIRVSTGEEALRASLQHDIALAILDVQMPAMDGYELAGFLRDDERTVNLPVIFLTAADAAGRQVLKAYEAGAVDYIVKPYKPAILLGKVKVFLELDRQRKELQQHRDNLQDLVAERTAKLDERVREIECLCAISGLAAAPCDDVGNAFSRAVDLIPPGFGGPGVAGARITYEDQAWTTPDFPETDTRLCAEIVVSKETAGTVDVHLREDRTPDQNRETFIAEKQGLATAIAGQLSVMLERKKAEEQRLSLERRMLQAQKLEGIGALAGGIAHDFNNLLTAIMNYVDLSRGAIDPENRAIRWLDEIMTAAQRSAKLVRQLLGFARRQTIEPEVLDLNTTLDGMLKLLRRLIGEDIDLAWKPGPDPWAIKVDPSQIDQILANLCVNARDAIGGVGKVTIRTRNTTLGADFCASNPDVTEGDYVALEVADTGCGMDEQTLEHLFDPFFTTKPEGEGTGLGLSTVHGIVKQSGGHIAVSSEKGKGSTFCVCLPRFQGETEGESKGGETGVEVTGGTETILVVEDEPSIRLSTALFLQKAGYTVISADTPDAAIRMAQSRSSGIDLLITDVVMPGMNGRVLSETLNDSFGGLAVLYMSGYTADVIANRGILANGIDFLHKPFSRTTLLRKVREVLEQSAGHPCHSS